MTTIIQIPDFQYFLVLVFCNCLVKLRITVIHAASFIEIVSAIVLKIAKTNTTKKPLQMHEAVRYL